MYITQLASCCAISEIGKLSIHRSPLASLESFCKNYRGVRGSNKLVVDEMTSYYIFSGVVDEKGTKTDHDTVAGFVEDTEYGPKFAAYLLKHNLGTIVQCPKRINDNHPLHTVQCWVWCPDKDKLAKWWKDRVDSGVVR